MLDFPNRSFGRPFGLWLGVILSVLTISIPFDVAAQGQESATTTGAGTYVCTPAGFGRKSTCYRR